MKKFLFSLLICATTLLAADETKPVTEVEVLSDTSFQYMSNGTWKVVLPNDHISYKEVDMNLALVLTAISQSYDVATTFDGDKLFNLKKTVKKITLIKK